MAEMTSLIDLYDSDILEIEKAVTALDEWARERNWRVPLEDYRLRCLDTFEKAGFKVDIRVWTAKIEGVNGFVFEGQISGRVDPKTFDPDRQVHEEVNDLLELGEGGYIKTPTEAYGNPLKGTSHEHHGHRH